MAQIDEGVFRDWQNNDKILAEDYKREREILRVAVNDTNDKLDLIQPERFEAVKETIGLLGDQVGTLEEKQSNLNSLADGVQTSLTQAHENINAVTEEANNIQTIITDNQIVKLDEFKVTEGEVSVLKDHGKLLSEYKGIDKTGETDISAIVQQAIDDLPDDMTLVFPRGVYLMSGITSTGKSIKIKGIGAKIIQSQDKPVFDFTGGFTDITNVLSVDQELSPLLTYTATPVGTITVSNASAFKSGDHIRLYSSDLGNMDSGHGYNYGELAIISEIIGNKIYLKNRLRYFGKYATGLKIGKIQDVSFEIDGISFDTVETDYMNSEWRANYIQIKDAVQPIVSNVKCERGVHCFVVFTNCYGYRAINVDGKNLRTDIPRDVYGYLIKDCWCEYGFVDNPYAENVRHLYTSNGSPYGRASFATITDGIAVNCHDSAFDTHPDSFAIEFINCKAYGNRIGMSGVSTPAFQSRGERTTFRGCKAYNCDVGFFMSSITKDFLIEDCETFDSYYAGLLVRKLETTPADHVINGRVRRSSFDRVSGSDAVDIRSGSSVDFVDTAIVMKNKDTLSSEYIYGFSVTDRSRVSFDGIRIYMSEVTGSANFRFLRNLQYSTLRGKNLVLRKGNTNVSVNYAGDGTAITRIENASGDVVNASEYSLGDWKIDYMSEDNSFSTFAISQYVNANNLTMKSEASRAYRKNITYIVNLTADFLYSSFVPGSFVGQTLAFINISNYVLTLTNAANVTLASSITVSKNKVVQFVWTGTTWLNI